MGTEEAKAHIQERFNGEIIVVPPESGVFCDYREDRVWLHVDENGKVNQVPHPG